jgi:hypothetical protein
MVKIIRRVHLPRRRGSRVLSVAVLTAALAATVAGAQRWTGGFGRTEPEYDGRFTFVRLRWGSDVGWGRRGMSDAWNHDYPRAEDNLTALLKELTLVDTHRVGTLVLTLDDPRLFRYPVAMMWEPGFWTMTDLESERFREYLLKGGFVIFDDFEHEQWNNLEAQMRRVLPGARWVKLDRSHRIFDSFFRMDTIDFPHPMYGILPTYYGVFEDNDPTRRLMAIANHNNDVAEYWEWSGRGMFPVDPSNEAYKLGINYVLYGLTH